MVVVELTQQREINMKSKFLKLFKQECLTYGDFTLASCQKSSYYLNSKKILCHPIGIELLGCILYEELKDLDFDCIGGPETGAISMATTTVLQFCKSNRFINSFYVRKDKKGYGSNCLVEGQIKAKDRVVVLEDVMTTGGSVRKAIDNLEYMGCEVIKIVCICDRLCGATENLSKYNYKPLFNINEVMSVT